MEKNTSEGGVPGESMRLDKDALDKELVQATGGKFIVAIENGEEEYMTLRYALADACDAKGPQEVQSRAEKYLLYKLMERVMDKKATLVLDAEEIVLMRKRVDVWTGLLPKGGPRVFGLISDIIGRSKE